MIKDCIKGLCRGMAVFIMLTLGLSGVMVCGATPEIYAGRGNDSGEKVKVVGVDGSAKKTVEEMEDSGEVVLFEGSAQPSTTVTIEKNKLIKCEGFRTNYFKATCGDVTAVAYCIQPKLKGDETANQKVNAYNDERMRKALYYSYGYPGYNERTKVYLDGLDLRDCYEDNNGRYALCHLMLSFVYDGEKKGSYAFRGCSEKTKKIVKDLLAEIKKWPEPDREAALKLSEEEVKAEWNFDMNCQITPPITLMANSRKNHIFVKVPDGATMYRYVSGEDKNRLSSTSVDMFDSDDEEVMICSGESFRFSAPSSVRGVHQSALMTGGISTTQPYLLHLTKKQDRIFGLEDSASVSFSIEWMKFGDLILKKNSSDGMLTDNNDYYSLKGARYLVNCKKSGALAGVLTTDAKGIGVLRNLPHGEYSVVEKDAPRGFVIDLKEHDISMNSPETVMNVKEDPAEICLRTSAVEEKSGRRAFYNHGEAVIKDTVTYSGLEPGQEYRLIGKLVDKDTGRPLKNMSSETSFVPEKSDGVICIKFNIDSNLLAGREIVVFERLYFGENLLATHEDINDKAQTIKVLKHTDCTPQTGDDMPTAALIILLISALAALCGGFVRSSERG